MQFSSAMLLSDWLIFGLLAITIVCFFWMKRYPHLRAPWLQVMQSRIGMISLVILSFYAITGLLDSIHLNVTPPTKQNSPATSQIKSVLDLIIAPLGKNDEKTYSTPFATHLLSKALVTLPNGQEVRDYPRLKHGGAHLQNPSQEKTTDIIKKILWGLGIALITLLFIVVSPIWFLAHRHKKPLYIYWQSIIKGQTTIAWREAIITFSAVWITLTILFSLATHYHIFGTNKIGQDIFYETIKSIRTGLLIGTLTTLFMLPFAVILGTLAGYFRGWVDDIIQYVYTTLSSIPGVLLISAVILVLQVYISNHEALFPTLIQRADARLLALCLILGITSWASLCRLLRGETLKLRNQEFIQAARSLAVGKSKIILRHIIPNVMHIVLITLALDFSSLVLAEAVLSYVGVGVDPTTMSWGNMINSSRLELAREPIVWWPLLAALIFMFILVLAANLFADTVRDAFDPRLRQLEE